MVATNSQMLELGTRAPTFSLPEADGNIHSLKPGDDANALLVMFISNHCPFVKLVADELAAISRDYADRGVAIFAINSNDVERYPADAPEAMKRESEDRGYGFPYLLDESQQVAKDYRLPARQTFTSSINRRRSCTAASWTAAVRATAYP